MALHRDYPVDLPPPYLRYHTSSQQTPPGRAPICATPLPDGSFCIPRMPTAEELAVSPIPDGFRCPLCLDVLDQPTTTVPCGHTFCERCMEQNFNESGESLGSNDIQTTRCPVCRSVIRRDHLGPCWIVRALIESIVIGCDYGVSFDLDSEQYEPGTPGGCTQTFKMSERGAHLQECGFVMIACQYGEDGCDLMARRSQIATHEQECKYRSEDCKCGNRVRSLHWEAHQEVCGSVEVGCPHQGHGCPHLCMRGDLEHHLSMCPYESLKDLLEEKERTIQDLQKANYKLESSLWTALKSKQQMEAELAELRWHAENGTQGADGGPHRASTPPQLAAFDAVAYNRHAMSEGTQDDKFGEGSSDWHPSGTSNPSPQQLRLVKSLSSDRPGRKYYREVSDPSKYQRERQADSRLTRIRTAARAHMVPENRDGEGDEVGANPGSSLNDIPPFRGSKTYPIDFVGGQGRLAPSLGRAEEGAAESVDPQGRLSQAARALVQWRPVGNDRMKNSQVRSSSMQFSV